LQQLKIQFVDAEIIAKISVAKTAKSGDTKSKHAEQQALLELFE
jgi:hypothetical protein